MGPCACSRTVDWEEGWDSAVAAGSCVLGACESRLASLVVSCFAKEIGMLMVVVQTC